MASHTPRTANGRTYGGHVDLDLQLAWKDAALKPAVSAATPTVSKPPLTVGYVDLALLLA